MAKDITVHFVGSARDLAASAALAGESVERFGHKVAVAGAESAVASAGFDLSSLKLIDMGRAGVSPTNILIGMGVALTAIVSPAIVAFTGLIADLVLGLTLLGSLAGLGGALVALTAWSQGWLDAGKNLETAKKELTAAQEAIERSSKPTIAQLDRLKDAQSAYNAALVAADNPLTRFLDHIQEMGRRLGQQALPVATRILEWADSMIPKVEQLGSRLVEWFGPRLEPTLKLAEQFFNNVTDALEDLGRRMTPVFDKLLKDPEGFEKAFTTSLHIVVDAIIGLVENFQRAADWWTGPEGQHMESQAVRILDVIGHAVEILIESFYLLARAMSFVGDRFDDLGNAIERFTAPLERAIGLWDMLATRLGHGLPHVPSIGPHGGGGSSNLFAQHGGIFPPGSMVNVGEVAQEVAYALPGGGMMVMPTGSGRSGGGSTYNINVSVSPLATPAEVGSAIVDAIQQYERRSSNAWRR